MTDREKFIKAAMAAIPADVLGVPVHSVDDPGESGPVVFGVNFLLSADQVTFFVSASEREIRMNAGDIAGLAKRRVAAAFRDAPAAFAAKAA